MKTKTFAEEKVYHFHSLEIEEQLAILWYIYQDLIKDNITPEPERPNEQLEKSEGLIEKVLDMSFEEQLQLQKDLIIGKDREELQAYRDYSSNQKLFFWYRLAQEMEKATVVQVPDDYRLSPDAQQLLDSIERASFANQLVFLRDVVGLGVAQRYEVNV